jgi:hypothetical protein
MHTDTFLKEIVFDDDFDCTLMNNIGIELDADGLIMQVVHDEIIILSSPTFSLPFDIRNKSEQSKLLCRHTKLLIVVAESTG